MIEGMKIEQDGKQYCEMYVCSMAEVMGLSSKSSRPLRFPVTGFMKNKDTGDALPVLDILMMSDERWQELAAEQAVKHYTEKHGYAPESVQQAFEWQRIWIAQMT